MMFIQPVILSGGSGTRLWPLSREAYPKQLLSLLDDQSLLQATLARLAHINSLEVKEPIIICNQDYRYLVAEQLRLLGLKGNIILEPIGKNTAPAITLAALATLENKHPTVLLVMPADHVMEDTDAFQNTLLAAAHLASQGKIVTFGIEPTSPETAYGYIEKGNTLECALGSAYEITSFQEKPSLELAQHLLKSKNHLWNSGIFVIDPVYWVNALTQLRKDILIPCQQAWERRKTKGEFCFIDNNAFEHSPSVSIDYAVMEQIGCTNKMQDQHTKILQGAVIPLDTGWSDVGSWNAVWKISPKDDAGNVTKGNVIQLDCHNSLLFSDQSLVACLGINDLVVVETQDAILIAPQDRVQEVRRLVSEVKRQGNSQSLNHRKVHQPWGWYDSIVSGQGFQVKQIAVKPGGKFALQLNKRRCEHWTVVKGVALVTLDEKVLHLSANESTYIPQEVAHRLENPQDDWLELIAIECGDHLEENDIIGLDDTYAQS